WYAHDIIAASEAGIVNGRTTTTFAPEETLTRQEMTVMLMKAYEISTSNSMDASITSSFADVDKIASWAIASVNAAHQLGYVKGIGDSLFIPTGTATRAEAAQMISQL